MNIKPTPILNRNIGSISQGGAITPKSIGYSYLNGQSIVSHASPPPILTFGTPRSPSPLPSQFLSIYNPSSPANLNGLIPPGGTPRNTAMGGNNGLMSGIVTSLFS
jgi:hypothetical protein